MPLPRGPLGTYLGTRTVLTSALPSPVLTTDRPPVWDAYILPAAAAFGSVRDAVGPCMQACLPCKPSALAPISRPRLNMQPGCASQQLGVCTRSKRPPPTSVEASAQTEKTSCDECNCRKNGPGGLLAWRDLHPARLRVRRSTGASPGSCLPTLVHYTVILGRDSVPSTINRPESGALRNSLEPSHHRAE